MKKLGVVITDGVGFRNFIMSDFLKEAAQQFDSVIVYSGLPKSAYQSINYSNIIIKELSVFEEPKLTWFFRKWKEVAHLKRHANFFGMEAALKMGYPSNNSLRSILVKFIYFFTTIIHSSKSILFIEKLQFLSFSKHKITKEYIQLLKEDAPTQVFFTHQRPPYVAPFLYAAIKLNITSSTFIFSWDNLASKGRMLGTFNRFLVWSDLMKQELLYFYPNVKDTDVKVVGTPQFEPYVLDRYLSTKSAFYATFDLDVEKKVICYSCADVSIGKNDPIVITAIANAIRNKTIVENVQLLVRTSPAEDDARFSEVKKQFPEIKWNVPKWLLTRENHAESWSQRIPKDEDIKDLRSLLMYADLNINMCSTMSLDFMLFDKPVINTVFGNEQNGLYNDQLFLEYDHYKKVVESDAVVIAKNETELILAINEELANPKKRTQQRKQLIALQISKELQGTSKRIATVLNTLCK
jgi:hypothetical protein